MRSRTEIKPPNNLQKAMALIMDKMSEAGGFDFKSDLSVKINYDVFSDSEKQVPKNNLSYRAVGHVKMPGDYYLKLSDKSEDKDIFEVSDIGGKKYTKFLVSNLINSKSRNYGLVSRDVWKEIDPVYTVTGEKIDAYNIALAFNFVDYLVNLDDFDFETVKVFNKTDKFYYYKGEIDDNKFRNYALAGMVNAITPKSISGFYASRELEVDKKTFLINSEKIKVRVTAKVQGEEKEIFTFSVSSSFSNYGAGKGIEDVSDVGQLIKNENLMASVESSNPADAQRKRSLYFIARGLDNYYRDNGGYPVSDSEISTDDENSPLRDLAPMYLLEGNLKSQDDSHHFIYKSDGKSYELFTVLKDSDDKWCVNEEGNCVYRIKSGVVVSRK
jgi:hypothetical protein